MSYRGRFAPSPTGQLHFGSLVAAVGSWLCARHAGGEWLLRMEDIDPPREVPGSAAGILAALPAFGLVADAPSLFQSRRLAAYDAAFERLCEAGQVFPCWCSRSELAGAGGIHRDGRCVAAPQPGQASAWRLLAPDLVIEFDDALQGPQRQNLRDEVGDFVIRRVEGFYSYQLACVVDDAHQGITEVVRGLDLLDSTARQIWLQRCLGLATPAYRHLPLVLDGEGRKLSKSGQAFPVDPADPLPALRRALAFLRVPAPAMAVDASDLLAQALANFDPAYLPHCSGHSFA
ncbi:tRNA glutamyl-Q synthetase [Rhodanobacter sp. FW510-R12]|uniref:tRNA glutamyl-Q(34) synthetase GluQRS n=1 Tax=unclassified Rhodanobacter TaxID=2621553 RepID=UPI0007AA1DCD|nr:MULTISPECIES: tRNA glutamyl-Q(34) synthetase GluQRS [unclassified Rhodanobacter]KZC18247.1 tRNA glutamyl-Q synthetase [Rhodanobacter sp. FW104-R8]KZC25632.1 tRNA glutamyl-Q synthetase [Rhodanobacter sp. FW510-T8]KZC32939.1 tRNA glutamyl-Q synthetase [Rhodanobacter sp. FW510-R10]